MAAVIACGLTVSLQPLLQVTSLQPLLQVLLLSTSKQALVAAIMQRCDMGTCGCHT